MNIMNHPDFVNFANYARYLETLFYKGENQELTEEESQKLTELYDLLEQEVVINKLKGY